MGLGVGLGGGLGGGLGVGLGGGLSKINLIFLVKLVGQNQYYVYYVLIHGYGYALKDQSAPHGGGPR